MHGTTVLAATLFLAAAPAAAQEYVWNADRSDGVAPIGIPTDRTLEGDTIKVGYRFAHMDARGLKFGEADVLETDVLDLGFTFVPLSRTADAHLVTLGWGLTDALTLRVSGGYVTKTRETSNDSTYFVSGSSGVTDLQADALWEVYREGAYRGHL